MTAPIPRGILWRLDLAQKVLDKAKRAFSSGDETRGKRLCAFARALVSECDVDDFETAKSDGRIVEIRAAVNEHAEILERFASEIEAGEARTGT